MKSQQYLFLTLKDTCFDRPVMECVEITCKCPEHLLWFQALLDLTALQIAVEQYKSQDTMQVLFLIFIECFFNPNSRDKTQD